MRFVFGRDEEIASWVAHRLGDEGFHRFDAAWGLASCDGELQGGVVFSNYTGDAVALSLAGGWVFRRSNLMAIVDYAFRQLGCSRLEVRIRESDRKLKKVLPRLGLEFEGIARHFYGTEDALMFSLTGRNLPKFIKKWG